MKRQIKKHVSFPEVNKQPACILPDDHWWRSGFTVIRRWGGEFTEFTYKGVSGGISFLFSWNKFSQIHDEISKLVLKWTMVIWFVFCLSCPLILIRIANKVWKLLTCIWNVSIFYMDFIYICTNNKQIYKYSRFSKFTSTSN